MDFFRISLFLLYYFYITVSVSIFHVFLFFHVPLFSCSTFFHVAFLCSNLFVLPSFYVLLYFMLHFHTLQGILFPFFSSFSLRMLQYFPATLGASCTISRGLAVSPTSKAISKAVKYCCKALHLRCLRGLGCASIISMFLLFLVAFFPCCSPFLLHFFNIENERKTQPKNDLTLSTLNLFHLYFWHPITPFCYYRVLNGWQSRKEPIYSFC